jgi:hypothetical protein
VHVADHEGKRCRRVGGQGRAAAAPAQTGAGGTRKRRRARTHPQGVATPPGRRPAAAAAAASAAAAGAVSPTHALAARAARAAPRLCAVLPLILQAHDPVLVLQQHVQPVVGWVPDMELLQVMHDMLEKTLMPAAEERTSGEQGLQQLQTRPGFVPALFTVLGTPAVRLEVRQAAALYCKNFVRASWKGGARGSVRMLRRVPAVQVVAERERERARESESESEGKARARARARARVRARARARTRDRDRDRDRDREREREQE